MTTAPFDPEAVAAELEASERTAAPAPLLTGRWPDLAWADARAVATARDRLRRQAGETLIGYKLGWTSAAMREALGIDRPNWGTLWDTHRIDDGAVDLSALIHPKVEPELVYRSPGGLAPDATGAGVAEAGGEWALGLEIVDPRFPSYDFDWLDNTADNSSAARVVIGEFRPLAEPAEAAVTFGAGGEPRAGVGGNAMGDPREAVAWLARSLAAEGASLAPGDIVFTGGLAAPFDLEAGAVYTLNSPDLGTLTLRAEG